MFEFKFGMNYYWLGMTSQFSGPQQQGLDSITLEVGLMLVIKVFGFWFLGSGMLGRGFFWFWFWVCFCFLIIADT